MASQRAFPEEDFISFSRKGHILKVGRKEHFLKLCRKEQYPRSGTLRAVSTRSYSVKDGKVYFYSNLKVTFIQNYASTTAKIASLTFERVSPDGAHQFLE